MRDRIIVKRYAEAFAGFAREGSGLEKVLGELKNLKNVVINENPDFLELLHGPAVPFSEKCDFIDRVLAEGFSLEVRQLLKLLLEKGRIDKLLGIMEYLRLTYSHGREEEALLKTAFPLDLKLIREIEERLERKLKKKLKFYIDLDPSLLGGVQVVVGNTIIDGSVRKQLDELGEKLMAIKV
ncbi:MAG: ATP synthase F1 subunit delta [Candidatus Omnitrophica bacterium]|nr:ATP synthase F1 subunit delta [Candidatus Omnitrophota bacterium]